MICPEDCDCCAIVDSRGIPTEGAENGAGAPDGATVALDGTTDMVLLFGGEIIDGVDGGADFEIRGTVTSAAQGDATARCPSVLSGAGFEVRVSPDGSTWQGVGFWTPETSAFDLGCTSLDAVSWIRIRGMAGATGELDAIVAVPASCPLGQGSGS